MKRGKQEILWRRKLVQILEHHLDFLLWAYKAQFQIGADNILNSNGCVREGACRHEGERQDMLRSGPAPPATAAASICTVIKNQQLMCDVRQLCWRERAAFRMQGSNLVSSTDSIQHLETI